MDIPKGEKKNCWSKIYLREAREKKNYIIDENAMVEKRVKREKKLLTYC